MRGTYESYKINADARNFEKYLKYFTVLDGIVPLVLRVHCVGTGDLQEIEIREIEIRVEFTPARLVRSAPNFCVKINEHSVTFSGAVTRSLRCISNFKIAKRSRSFRLAIFSQKLCEEKSL